MKHVILLGDSIRMQYQEPVGRLLADIATVSGPEENGHEVRGTYRSEAAKKFAKNSLTHRWGCGNIYVS